MAAWGISRVGRRTSKAFALLLALAGAAAAPAAAEVPSGFQETTAYSGLTHPTVVRFAPDGRVFIAEKSGIVKVLDGLSDPTPSVFADLRTQVYNFWDRGLLGMAIERNFDQTPSVYVTYAHDAAIGGVAPRWGTAGATSDPCPTPPGPMSDGCVVSGRISRLVASGNAMEREEVMIEDYCQQYPSHSIGTLEQDSAGNLWASGGDGASFAFADYGQDGSPPNPCGDPPGGVGATLTPPTAEGGSLRSQDLRTTADPTGLNGTLIRINPNNAQGVAGNPLAGSDDANERRIVAYGLRNPFRFTVSDGRVYAGDVGWGTWEEINSFPAGGAMFNFGWPCYEGNGRQPGYDAANLNVCEGLYGSPGAVTPPLFAYNHGANIVPGEACATGSSSISGLEVYQGSTFPAAYDGALFFADYSRGCIWVMTEGSNGQPDPSTVATFDAPAAGPVNLEVGPDGALYYPDFDGGRIVRIQYASANQPPIAVASANPTNGPVPLTVNFDGTGSSDLDDDPLSYAWDLDADGQYDDSTSPTPSRTYTQAGTYVVSLRVTDDAGASGAATVTIQAGNSPPVPTIQSPLSSRTWNVGEKVDFAGSASDPEDGPLPASALDWQLILNHCPSNCHQHTIQSFPDTLSGSFFGPDHEYPSHLELRLTATDSRGLQATKSVLLQPRWVKITLQSQPNAMRVVLNGISRVTPFTTKVIQKSTNSISAVSPQTKGSVTYEWTKWSDGGARTHNILAKINKTYKATFQARFP